MSHYFYDLCYLNYLSAAQGCYLQFALPLQSGLAVHLIVLSLLPLWLKVHIRSFDWSCSLLSRSYDLRDRKIKHKANAPVNKVERTFTLWSMVMHQIFDCNHIEIEHGWVGQISHGQRVRAHALLSRFDLYFIWSSAAFFHTNLYAEIVPLADAYAESFMFSSSLAQMYFHWEA